MTKILYVEDELFLAKIVKETLQKNGYEITHVANGAEALENFQTFKPDICVLDVMLPDRNGFEIATDIRQIDKNIPILFLTAKNQTEDLAKGFKSGGNDYIKKPFSMEELMIRMENLLGVYQTQTPLTEEIKIGNDFTFIPKKYELYHNKKTLTLSFKENQLLEMLCQNKKGTTYRKDILVKIWDDDNYFNSRTLDVYIRKLRKYFELDPTVEIITLKGVGYQLID